MPGCINCECAQVWPFCSAQVGFYLLSNVATGNLRKMLILFWKQGLGVSSNALCRSGVRRKLTELTWGHQREVPLERAYKQNSLRRKTLRWFTTVTVSPPTVILATCVQTLHSCSLNNVFSTAAKSALLKRCAVSTKTKPAGRLLLPVVSWCHTAHFRQLEDEIRVFEHLTLF